MAYAQVKLLQTWKLAAFIVAFFSSFLAHSEVAIDFSKLEGKPPKVDNSSYCVTASRGGITAQGCSDTEAGTYMEACNAWIAAAPKTPDGETKAYHGYECIIYPNPDSLPYLIQPYTKTYSNGSTSPGTDYHATMGYLNDMHSITAKTCPPDGFQGHTVDYDQDGDGETDICYHPNDIQAQLDEKNELEKNEDYCNSLILDSGNNTATTMCYSAYNGASCTVSQVTVSDATYYQGVENEALGCGSSENPAYDQSGVGDEKDSCIFSNGTNYCQADKGKHCQTVQGSEICDDGCISDGVNLFCDTSKHPDVGENESDYFNDNGTCSVISASSSKGFCEEMGGTWDETQDYQEASCPSGGGTCSVPTAGFCQACFDAGGTWTPDGSTDQTDETKASLEVAALVKKSNEKLTQIESGQRKIMEATTSTIKSGNDKIIASLAELSSITKSSGSAIIASNEEEKESFTTTTQDADKSKLSALFNDASKTALQADIDQLKTDTTNFINTAKTEASALMSITVPSSSGYETRTLTLSQGSFDVSLSRFSSFFAMLAGPVMLVCSIISGFILLGRND